jgi:hypothetical protein
MLISDDTKMLNRATRQKEIAQANSMLASKLEEKYKIRADSFVVANKVTALLGLHVFLVTMFPA